MKWKEARLILKVVDNMNTENYTKQEAPKVIAEAERKLNSYKSRVDPERTKDNYDLAEQFGDRSGETPSEKLERLIDETPHSNRKDLKVLGTWIIDPPKELIDQHPEDIPKFFEEAYKYFRDRVGAENILYGAVHMDETTPHLQFGYCPVVEDAKHPGQKKICVTEANPHAFVKKAHEVVSEYMTEKMGYEVSMLTGATENGRLRIEQLKAESLNKENEQLKAEKAELEGECEELKNDKAKLERKLSHTETALETARKEAKIRKGEGLPTGKQKLRGPRLNKEVVSVTYTPEENDRLQALAQETLVNKKAQHPLIGSELLDYVDTLRDSKEKLEARLRDMGQQYDALSEEHAETVCELLPYERETIRESAAEMRQQLEVAVDHSDGIWNQPEVLEMANNAMTMAKELDSATYRNENATPGNAVAVRNDMLGSVRHIISDHLPALNALNSSLSDAVKAEFYVIRNTIRTGLKKALKAIKADPDRFSLLPDREPPVEERKHHQSNSTPDGR